MCERRHGKAVAGLCHLVAGNARDAHTEVDGKVVLHRQDLHLVQERVLQHVGRLANIRMSVKEVIHTKHITCTAGNRRPRRTFTASAVKLLQTAADVAMQYCFLDMLFVASSSGISHLQCV